MTGLELVDLLQKLVTTAAIVSAGLWTYFNYAKGRLYKARLETALSARILTQDDTRYMVITTKLKNLGGAKVEVFQEGSGVRVFSYQAEAAMSATEAYTLPDERLATFPAFESTGWLEPGETIEEHRLIVLPPIQVFAFRIDLRLSSGKEAWRLSRIIPAMPDSEGREKEDSSDGKR